VPDDFDLKQHLGTSLGIFAGSKAKDFKIRVSAYGARWVIEDPWHADQRVEKQPDGSILLTVKAAHELEIIPRVLALGAEAEVLAPASCRKMIAEMVQRLAVIYAQP
jgi:predicted DNA-binding transcriptional regulator YafY